MTTRVLQLTSGVVYGGGQDVAIRLHLGLGSTEGFHSQILFAADQVHPSIRTAFENAESTPYDGRYNRLRSMFTAARALRREVKARKICIIHSHGWDVDIIAGLAIRGLNIRHIAHQHVMAKWVTSRRAVHVFRRLLTRLVLGGGRCQIVCVSRGVKDSLAPLSFLKPMESPVIWNGIDPARYGSRSEQHRSEVPIIGYAGRLAPGKGIEVLLDACAKCRDMGLNFRVAIAGDGPLRKQLEHQAEQLALTTRIEFLGHVVDMPDFYRKLDIFVLPSFSEGLPMTVLEAMASGLAVIGSNIPGISEIIDHGKNGLLFGTGEGIALSRALQKLLQNGDERNHLGDAARSLINSQFNHKCVLEKMTSVYRAFGLASETKR